jgi:hypothetical protein
VGHTREASMSAASFEVCFDYVWDGLTPMPVGDIAYGCETVDAECAEDAISQVRFRNVGKEKGGTMVRNVRIHSVAFKGRTVEAADRVATEHFRKTGATT